MCLARRPQRSDAGEAWTRAPSVSSQALYHWATALPHISWRVETPYLTELSHTSIFIDPKSGLLVVYGLFTLQYNLCKMATLKKTENWFQDRLSLNAGQKYCRMLPFAILLTFIKLLFVIKIFIMSIFKWLFYTGFTVYEFLISSPSSARISFLDTDSFCYEKQCGSWSAGFMRSQLIRIFSLFTPQLWKSWDDILLSACPSRNLSVALFMPTLGCWNFMKK